MIWIQVRGNALHSLCYMNASQSQGCHMLYNGTQISFPKVKQSLYFYKGFEIECQVKHNCKSKDIQDSKAKTLSIVNPRMYFTDPQWLMPVRELDSGTVVPLLGDGKTDLSSDTESIYRVKLVTSMDANSSLSDPRASVLLSIIGEHGRSIIHRISPLCHEGKESMAANSLRFQRGCKDMVAFYGPDLGMLLAIWIAPMSGTWRLESATITISPLHSNVEVNGINSVEQEIWDNKHRNTRYIFPGNDILIGDGAYVSAAELKPLLIHEISNFIIYNEFQLQNSVDKGNLNKEEGLKEYKALKMSVLCYDVVLVTCGTAIFLSLGMDAIAKGFFLGGLGSLLYLIFLQKVVDQLPAQGLITGSSNKNASSSGKYGGIANMNTGVGDNIDFSHGKVAVRSGDMINHTGHWFHNFQSPIARFAPVATVIFIASRLDIGTGNFSFSDKELLSGAMGFLMFKVSVLLAAYKPFPLSRKM